MMRVVLEIISEPSTGKKLWLRPGQRGDVGRSDQAVLAVPHDQWMSSLHFQVECDGTQCRLSDLDSRNGTRVNGRQVGEAVLADGDTIVAGETTFHVHIEGGAARDTELQSEQQDSAPAIAAGNGPRTRVGHWVCGVVPSGWEIMPEQGLRNTADEAFPSSLVCVEGNLAMDISLQEHVETLVQQYLEALPGCRCEGAVAIEVKGATEARRFLLEHPKRGDLELVQDYICVRQGEMVGMAVLTTSRDELQQSEELFGRILAGLAWEE